MEPYQLRETWRVAKPAVRGEAGLVSTQHYLASQAGARILREGGNAVDAAIAAGLALGVVEPWMSGIGGGGFMQHYAAETGEVSGIDFAMHSPLGLDPGDYPLVGGVGASATFNWPTVFEDRNTKGPRSIATPGHLAGCKLALERFGTFSWQQVMAPSLALVDFGLPLDWFATHKITNWARDLREHPSSARVYLPDGLPPVGRLDGLVTGLPWQELAATYHRLAEAGPEDFYDGTLAAALDADAREVGSSVRLADLNRYRAVPFAGAPIKYRDAKIWAPQGLNAGPSLERALASLESAWEREGAAPDAAAYAAYAAALLEAYAFRLEFLGAAEPAGNTSHMGVVDRFGNIVSWTQTIMSGFGSRVVFPRTGITMNNGIMWFDPTPDRPNSIRPGVRPLSNMCPTIVELADGFRFAIGACGGRKIFPAVFQLISFLVDFQYSLEDAMHQPRLDVSGTNQIALDERLGEALSAKLAKDWQVATVTHSVYPNPFALPNIVGQRTRENDFIGGAFVMSPTAEVVAA